MSVEKFVRALKKSPEGAIFNPWYDVDKDNDSTKSAPKIRREQLTQYLKERQEPAKLLLIAEAVGYQGGHFTGMAMTSERILLGHQAKKGILPEHVFQGIAPRRTSKKEVRDLGFNEPTATIVWSTLLDSGQSPYEFVLWNIFPWHPIRLNSDKGTLTNRTPTDAELLYAKPALQKFLALFPERPIVAIGKKSHGTLENMGIESIPVRHPANGGATLFRQQFTNYLNTL